MKRFKSKKLLSVFLAAVMTVSAVGCGKKSDKESDATATHDAKNYVYKEADISLGEGVDTNSLSKLGKFGDKLYAMGYSYTETSIDTIVYTFNKDGSDLQKITIPTGTNTNIMDLAISDDGSIYDVEVDYASYGMDETGDIDLSDIISGDVELVTDEITGGTEESSISSGEATESSDNESEAVEPETADDSSDDHADKPKPKSPEPEEEEAVEAAEDSEVSEEATETSEDAVNENSDDTSLDISGEGTLGEVSTEDKYYIVKRNPDGSEAFKKDLEIDADSYFYVTSIAVIEGKGLFLANDEGIHQYSLDDGSFIKDIGAPESSDEEGQNTLFAYAGKDGNLTVTGNDGDVLQFYKADIDNGTLTAVEGSTIEAYEYSVMPGISHDLILLNADGVFGYNMGDSEPTMLLNFIDSDIDSSGLYQLAEVSETEMFALIPSEDMGFTLALLTKVPPEEVKDKQIITLGCNYIDYDVRSHVVKFNKESDEYRIVITDYSDYDSDDDYLAGSNKLNTDIVSSNAPDILVLDMDMPVDSYIAKGLFQDLTDYFNNDEELSKKEFIKAMDAFKTDGKMYKLVPGFSVETVVAPTKYVGTDDYTWTIDELESIVKDKNIEYKNIFGTLSRMEVFDMALSLAGSQFIDWDTLQCSYNSDEFIHLLEFVNEFPLDLTEEDYESDNSPYWREGKSIASRINLASFSDYNYEKKGLFGEDIQFVGFPSDNGSGASMTPCLQLSMSSSSKVKDGCWQFMRYFLTEDYQKTIDGYFPVSMEQINTLSANAKKKPVYIDENGKEVEYDDTYYIGDSEIIVDPMTDEEINAVIDYLNSVTQIGHYNDSVSNIINEESEAFFSGQKTAAEVADIIQSRVQIYVNEIS